MQDASRTQQTLTVKPVDSFQRVIFALEEHLGLTLPVEERPELEHLINETVYHTFIPLRKEFSYELPRRLRKKPITITTPTEKHHLYLGRLLNNAQRSHQQIPSPGDLVTSVYEFFHGTTAPYVNRLLRNPELLQIMERVSFTEP